MSFLHALKSRLTPPKAALTLRLNKASYALGENIEGSLNISSQEGFDTIGLRCEIQCIEEAKRTRRVYDERLHAYVDTQVQESRARAVGQLKIDRV